MERDIQKEPSKTIARSIMVIVWWVSIWGITDYIIHHISAKSGMRKVATYLGLIMMVLGVTYLDKGMLNHL